MIFKNNYSKIKLLNAGVAELADALDLGSSGKTVQVQVLSPAPLLKLCKYYNCSSDYLLDLTDIKTPVNDLLINNLNSEEAELICKYRSFNSDDKNKVLGFFEAISCK